MSALVTIAASVFVAAAPGSDLLFVERDLESRSFEIVRVGETAPSFAMMTPAPGGVGGYIFDATPNCMVAFIDRAGDDLSGSKKAFRLVVARADATGQLIEKRVLLNAQTFLSKPRFSSDGLLIGVVESTSEAWSSRILILDSRTGAVRLTEAGVAFAWDTDGSLVTSTITRQTGQYCHQLIRLHGDKKVVLATACGGWHVAFPGSGVMPVGAPLPIYAPAPEATLLLSPNREPSKLTRRIEWAPVGLACPDGMTFWNSEGLPVSLQAKAGEWVEQQGAVCPIDSELRRLLSQANQGHRVVKALRCTAR